MIKPKKSAANISFALTETRPETVKLKSLFQKKYSKKLPVYAEIHSWDAIWNWVNEGYCGGLVPDFLLSDTGSKIDIMMKNICPYEIKVMYAKSRALDPLIVNFLKCF